MKVAVRLLSLLSLFGLFILATPLDLRAQFFFGMQKTWDGGGDGISWSDPQNWNPNGVPGPFSAVSINNGDAVRLDISSTARSISVDLSSSLEVRENLQVNGNITLSGTAKLFWRSNRIQANRIINRGTIQLSSANDKILGSPTFIENKAAINIFGSFFGSADLLMESNTTIQNDFQINIQGPNADLLFLINNNPLTIRIINNGSIRRKKPTFGSGGSTIINVSLENNWGSIISDGGSLLLQGSNLFLGARLEAGALDADIQIRGTTNRASGILSGNGLGKVRLLQDLEVINSGILLSFPRGGFYWERRPISGNNTIRNIGKVILTSSENKILRSGITFINQGNFLIQDGTLLGGNLLLSNNTTFDNEGILELDGADTDIGRVFNNNVDILLRNSGTILKGGIPFDGTATIRVPFENRNGIIEVRTGKLDLRNGGVIDGLQFNGSVLGELHLSNFNFEVSGDLFSGNSLGKFLLRSNLQVNGQVAFDFPKEVFRWVSGQMNNGNITNHDHIQLVSDGSIIPNNKTISAKAQFSNLGTMIFRDGQANGRNLFLNDSTTLVNEADIIFEGDSADIIGLSNDTRLVNFGAILKKQGQGQSTINAVVDNPGVIDAQTGILAFPNVLSHQTGALFQGQASISLSPAGSFSNQGMTNPGDSVSTARLSFLGNYNLPPNAQVIIDVNGPSLINEYDQIKVSGNATLEGQVQLNLNYLPACQDTLLILEANQITTCNLPDTVFANFAGMSVPYLVDCGNTIVQLIPQLQEVCGDGIDNDCDGQVDEGCPSPLRQLTAVAVEHDQSWEVFPKPVTDILHLKFSSQEPQNDNFSLTNSLGQVVQQWKLSGQSQQGPLTLNLSHLPRGMYTLTWRQADNIKSKLIHLQP